jgi:glycosyltransferase involved in cell wall biosynthesis
LERDRLSGLVAKAKRRIRRRWVRVAIVLNASWNVYNFRLGLLGALGREGYEIHVIAPHDEYTKRIPYPFHEMPMDGKGMNPFKETALVWRLYKLYRRLRPHVLLHFTPKPNIYGSIAGGMLGIPSICNVAGLGSSFEGNRVLALILRVLYRVALRYPFKVFFQNLEDQNLFYQLGLVAKEKSDRVPGSGIDVLKLQPRETSIERDCFTFLLASRMLREKGVVEFVEAARILKAGGTRAEFRLLGMLDVQNPSAISRMQMDGWQAEGSINYLGFTDRVADYMDEADCIVLPTYYREGVPRVLLEAAALGKPLISTQQAGCRDVLEDGRNGFTCKPRDALDLAHTMKRFMALSPEERAAMGRRSREKAVREFDENLVIGKYLEAIRSLSVRL